VEARTPAAGHPPWPAVAFPISSKAVSPPSRSGSWSSRSPASWPTPSSGGATVPEASASGRKPPLRPWMRSGSLACFSASTTMTTRRPWKRWIAPGASGNRRPCAVPARPWPGWRASPGVARRGSPGPTDRRVQAWSPSPARSRQATNRPYSQRTKPPTSGTGVKVGPTKSK
jgi:hypothetical protein